MKLVQWDRQDFRRIAYAFHAEDQAWCVKLQEFSGSSDKKDLVPEVSNGSKMF